ncbi:hypothetical protein AB395_0000760 [Sinorhizobium fredii CCBAU 45436]|nr:hypothetical protein AB395_0000760 [Sinorhizobium fredii CCBAU 45436]
MAAASVGQAHFLPVSLQFDRSTRGARQEQAGIEDDTTLAGDCRDRGYPLTFR